MISVPVPGILMMFMTTHLLIGLVIGLVVGGFIGVGAMALVVAGSTPERADLTRNSGLPTG